MDNLSNARAGQKQLSAIFRDKNAAEEEIPDTSNKSRILESLTNNIGQTILGRAFAVLATAPIALVAVLNIKFLGAATPNLFGIIAIVLLLAAAAVWPPLGLTLSAAVLGIALIGSGNYIVGGALAGISILWCVYSFRLKVSNSNSASAFPLFGSAGFAQAAPFISGLFCDVKDSIVNTFFGFAICLVLAGLGSQSLVG